MPNRPADLTTREGRERYRDVTVRFLQDQALAANICRLIDMLDDAERARNEASELKEFISLCSRSILHAVKCVPLEIEMYEMEKHRATEKYRARKQAQSIGLTGTTPAMAAE